MSRGKSEVHEDKCNTIDDIKKELTVENFLDLMHEVKDLKAKVAELEAKQKKE